MKKTFLTLCLILFLYQPGLQAGMELNLKAVFIGRIASFVEWNENSSEKFVISVYGDNTFGTMLKALYRDRFIHGKAVDVRDAETLDALKGSDIVYINTCDRTAMARVIDYTQAHGMLSISDCKGFAREGGIVQFYTVAQSVRLQINNEASKRAQLKISSRLLALSKIVEGGAQ